MRFFDGVVWALIGLAFVLAGTATLADFHDRYRDRVILYGFPDGAPPMEAGTRSSR
jgi:hypothetical protein